MQRSIAAIHKRMSSGDIKQALAASQRLVKHYPENPEAWFNLSRTTARARLFNHALQAVKKATSLAPRNSQYQAQLAYCLLHWGQVSEARSVAKKTMHFPKLAAQTWDMLGNVLTSCGELLTAHDCFQEAVVLAPEKSHFLFNLATSLRSLGRLPEAELAFTRVIAVQANDWDAYLARSNLRTWKTDDNHISELQSRLSTTSSDSPGELKLCYALARELEDIADYENSFRYLERASKLRRQRSTYQVENEIDAMKQIREVFNLERLSHAGPGFDNEEPVFILGLPRTGTTLVERILCSHTDVFAAGELQNFAVELVKLAQQTFAGESLGKLELIKKSSQLNFAELGKAFISSTRPRTGNHRCFIDKMPLNYLYIGLIHLALPRAKIIHLTRHPMDACYAIYKTLFEQAYPFSYDLDDLGRYYIAYRKLMAHWQRTLGEKILNVSYEGLTEDQEGVSREIVEFCGLDWQDACLNFKHNPTPIATASSSQVRQGIYKTSVQRWCCYEKQLSPLRELLTDAGIALEPW